MRKNMTKEVTKTVAKVAKTVVGENGLPEVQQLEDEILLGNVSQEKAQKLIQKRHDETVTVYKVEANTEIYTMPVEEFIKFATLKTDDEVEEETEENEVE
jgi:hypothetical protein